MVPETRVFQAVDSEDLVILACTVFYRSTHVMDGWTDRWTELWWLRCATAVAAVAFKIVVIHLSCVATEIWSIKSHDAFNISWHTSWLWPLCVTVHWVSQL